MDMPDDGNSSMTPLTWEELQFIREVREGRHLGYEITAKGVAALDAARMRQLPIVRKTRLSDHPQ